MAKIGIALGGGGVRGLAHIGVLQVLEDEGIPIYCITGSSVGAIVGAAYAQTPHAGDLLYRFRESLGKYKFYKDVEAACKGELGEMEPKENFWNQVSKRVKQRVIINLAQSKKELFPQAPVIEVIRDLIEEGDVEDTNMLLGIVALDLHTGQPIVITEGDIIQAVIASSSVTGYLAPVEYGDALLTDGGSIAPVPTEFLSALGADIIIGVDISYTKCCKLDNCSIINTVLRVDMHRAKKLAELMMDIADVKIRPNTGNVHWSQFSRFEECLAAGIEAGKAAIPGIKLAIEMFDEANKPPEEPPAKEKWWERVLNYIGEVGQYA
jgi:NTE family protein